MKSTGIVRKVDALGRVVLPVELRNGMSFSEKESLEIFIEGNYILLKKYSPGCIFCGGSKKLIHVKEKAICLKCRNALSKKSK